MSNTRDDLISGFYRLWLKLGRQPSKKDWIDDCDTPSDMPIRAKFGNWTSFVEEMGLAPLKFIPTLNGITRKGKRNKSRTRIEGYNGYLLVYEPDHPTSSKNGYCLEHRKIAWDAGILTDIRLVVHHKDGNKKNNAVANLEAMTILDHTSLHSRGVKKKIKAQASCKYSARKEATGSKYRLLCRNHYKTPWQRVKSGLIGSVYQNPELLESGE